MSNDSAIIINWGLAHPGRETMGLGVFQAALAFSGKLKAGNAIADYQVFLRTTGNATALQGTMVTTGTPEQIAALVQNEDWNDILVKAQHVASNFSVQLADTGGAVPRRIENLMKVRAELGIK